MLSSNHIQLHLKHRLYATGSYHALMAGKWKRMGATPLGFGIQTGGGSVCSDFPHYLIDFSSGLNSLHLREQINQHR